MDGSSAQRHGAIQIGQCVVEIVVHRAGVAAISPSIRVLGIKLERPLVIGDGRVPFGHLAESGAAAVVRRSVFRVQFDRLIQIRQRFAGLAGHRTGKAAIAVCVFVLWIEFDGLVVVGDRLVEIIETELGETAIEVRKRLLGIDGDGRVEIGNCLLPIALVNVGKPLAAKRGSVLIVRLDGLGKGGDGLVVLAFI